MTVEQRSELELLFATIPADQRSQLKRVPSPERPISPRQVAQQRLQQERYERDVLELLREEGVARVMCQREERDDFVAKKHAWLRQQIVLYTKEEATSHPIVTPR